MDRKDKVAVSTAIIRMVMAQHFACTGRPEVRSRGLEGIDVFRLLGLVALP